MVIVGIMFGISVGVAMLATGDIYGSDRERQRQLTKQSKFESINIPFNFISLELSYSVSGFLFQ